MSTYTSTFAPANLGTSLEEDSAPLLQAEHELDVLCVSVHGAFKAHVRPGRIEDAVLVNVRDKRLGCH